MKAFRKPFKKTTSYPWVFASGARFLGFGSWGFVALLAFYSMSQSLKEDTFFYRQRVHLLDFTAPLVVLAQKTTDYFVALKEYGRSYGALKEEVFALRQQRDSLLKWQHRARLLAQENDSLRQQLHVIPDPVFKGITARVMGREQSAYTDNLIISGNESHGIQKNKAVVTPGGVLGRTQEVGAYTTRVLLMTDWNSRIPVLVQPQQEEGVNPRKVTQGIAVGDGQGGVLLSYVEDPHQLKEGDVLYTSGVGGVFPPQLPLGVIKEIQGEKISVTPYANLSKVEFVRILTLQ